MMFISMIFVVIVIIVFVLSLIGTVAGGICLGIFYKKMKAGAGYGKPLMVISAVVLGISGTFLLLSGVFFAHSIYGNAQPKEDYVETGVFTEEKGFQEKNFTVNGVEYEVLDFEANDDFCMEYSTPVFSYEPKDFWDGSQYGNYYRVDNNQNFDLIWSEYEYLYCPKEDKKKIESYYEQDISKWYVDNEFMEYVLLETETEQKIEEFLKDIVSNPPKDEYIFDDVEWIDIVKISSDHIVKKQTIGLAYVDHAMYYVESCDYDKDDRLVCIGKKLEDDLGKAIWEKYIFTE